MNVQIDSATLSWIIGSNVYFAQASLSIMAIVWFLSYGVVRIYLLIDGLLRHNSPTSELAFGLLQRLHLWTILRPFPLRIISDVLCHIVCDFVVQDTGPVVL